MKAYPSHDVPMKHADISSAALKRDADLAVDPLVRHYTRTGKYLIEMYRLIRSS